MFNEEEIKLILQDFPKFELCYEIMTHKKVPGSCAILAIPEGKKCFTWFTSFKNDNVCFLLEINENKNIIDIQILVTSFTDILALGTIFYGVFFKNKSYHYFCIEDIYYYAGKSFYNQTYLTKLQKIKEIMEKQMSQMALINKFTIFGLPLIMDDFQLMLKEIQLLPYKVNELKFRFFEKVNSKKIMVMKYFKQNIQKQDNNPKEAIFKITADIEPDIYNLFICNNGIEEYYDIAFIPDYKTSVMMNKLFRNIKENDDLDKIEESDNEDEFEDIREDKFVYLDRAFKMRCAFNSKFKRWVPIGTVSPNWKEK
jgi:hypothetical protein